MEKVTSLWNIPKEIDSFFQKFFKRAASIKEINNFLNIKEWKPKTKDCQGRSHLIHSQERPSSKLYMFILCVI